MAKNKGNLIAQNRKAGHDYTILDTIEAGLVLKGTEIKSIRAGRINLKDGFASLSRGEVWLYNVHIAPFEQGNRFNHDPYRVRKLLLKQKEIDKIVGDVNQSGITLVPLKVYIKHGVAKVLLGIAKGKKKYDKRESLKRKDQERQIQRALKNRQ